MRIVRWIAILAAFGLMLYTCALPGDLPADVEPREGLAGTYTTNGITPAGNEFSGTAVITATDDPERFDLQLLITGAILSGTIGPSGADLEFTWATVDSAVGDESGVGRLSSDGDGNLAGTWTITDSTVAEAEGAGGEIELFVKP